MSTLRTQARAYRALASGFAAVCKEENEAGRASIGFAMSAQSRAYAAAAQRLEDQAAAELHIVGTVPELPLDGQ